MAASVKWDQCSNELFKLRKKVLPCGRTLTLVLMDVSE